MIAMFSSKNGVIIVVVTLPYPISPDTFKSYYFSWHLGIFVFGFGTTVGQNVIISFNDTTPLIVGNVAAKTETSFTIVIIDDQYIIPGLS
jgi:hypothetical protein